MMKNCRHTTERGVTLVETMVVVAISAIMLSMAAPSFIGMTQKFRANGEASELLRDFQFTRSEAIKQGLPITICASADSLACSASTNWHSGWIVITEPIDINVTGTVLRIQKTWSSKDTFIANNDVSKVRFNRDGFAIGLPGLVTFTLHTSPANDNATRCIALIKTGRQELQNSGSGECL